MNYAAGRRLFRRWAKAHKLQFQAVEGGAGVRSGIVPQLVEDIDCRASLQCGTQSWPLDGVAAPAQRLNRR